jgi:flagellar assembly factor FliW
MVGKTAVKRNSKKYWSFKVTKESNALDLEKGVFTFENPKKIALSLKKSALESKRRKAGPFQSAMSMLNFYINRAGKNLPKDRKDILEKTKKELRKLFINKKN